MDGIVAHRKYFIIVTALTAWLLAQGLKIIIFYWRTGTFDLERLVGAGGMPSSHAALVVALAAAVGFDEGGDSALFAIAVVFAGVVMYDAAGVRQAAGKQAKAINRIVRQLRVEHTVRDISLKELLGHTPVEVMAGAALGFAVAYIFTKIMLIH